MSKHADKAPSVKLEGLVTSDSVHSVGPRKLQPWYLLSLVLMLVFGVAGLYGYTNNHKVEKVQPAGISKQGVVTLQQAQDNLQNAKSTSEKTDAYIALGNEYLNTRQYPEALDMFQKALPGTQNQVGVLRGIALVYEQTGQTTKEADIYSKMAAIYQASSDPKLQSIGEQYQKYAVYLLKGAAQ